MNEQDNVWKELLDYYFPQFMAFFFPAIDKDIDWRQPYEFLDKELEKLVRDSEIGRRLVDKLVKVYLNDGKSACLLIHIEVQGYSDIKFEERMYIYHYRIFDRYQEEVVSLAVLTDGDARFRPTNYQQTRWGFELTFRFPIIKLLDYNSQWETLEADPNPFAVVVMAQLKVLELRGANELLAWKLRLVRMLYQRGYERQDILELFRFIDWLVRLPIELEQQFQDEIRQEEGAKMPYVTSIERMGMERGLAEGLEKGREEGQLEGKLSLLLRQFGFKLGPLSSEVEASIRSLTSLQLDDLSLAWLEFKDPSELSSWLEAQVEE